MARQKVGTVAGKKRKKSVGKKATPARRRRRVGASGSIEPLLMNGLAVGGGVIAAREVSILAGGMFPSLMASPVMTGAFQLVAGGLTAYMSKSGWLRFLGLGAMGEGLMTVANGFGVIGSAPRQMSYSFQNRRIMGDPRLQFVAGPETRIGAYPNMFSTVAGNGIGAGHVRKRRYTS